MRAQIMSAALPRSGVFGTLDDLMGVFYVRTLMLSQKEGCDGYNRE